MFKALLAAGAISDAPERGLCRCLNSENLLLDPIFQHEALTCNEVFDDWPFPRWSALHVAGRQGHPYTAAVLLQCGAD
jgi:hypothetical protein